MHEAEPTRPAPTGVLGWYMRFMHSFGAALMGLIVVVMVMQVIARYVFNASLIWAEELTRYLLIWITFLFIGLAYYKGEMVTVDALTRLLSAKWRFALKAAVNVPVVVFLYLMVVNGYQYAERFKVQKIPALDFIWMSLTDGRTADISITWVYHSVTVGSAVLILHIVGELIAEGRQLFFGRDSATARRDANG